MKFTRAIALCALTLAIALAIGAIAPYQPLASAGSAPEHVVPTPALATAAPVVEQPAAPVVEQLPPPTPQVIYIQLPPPQVIYIQPAEIPAAAPLAEEIPAAAPLAEEIPAATAGDDYQQRRLAAINSGAAYRPSTR